MSGQTAKCGRHQQYLAAMDDKSAIRGVAVAPSTASGSGCCEGTGLVQSRTRANGAFGKLPMSSSGAESSDSSILPDDKLRHQGH